MIIIISTVDNLSYSLFSLHSGVARLLLNCLKIQQQATRQPLGLPVNYSLTHHTQTPSGHLKPSLPPQVSLLCWRTSLLPNATPQVPLSPCRPPCFPPPRHLHPPMRWWSSPCLPDLPLRWWISSPHPESHSHGQHSPMTR